MLLFSASFQIYHGIQLLLGQEARVCEETPDLRYKNWQSLWIKIGVEYIISTQPTLEPKTWVLTDRVINRPVDDYLNHLATEAPTLL